VCAANRLKDGMVIASASKIEDAEQGFINQWGVFLTREEAYRVVKASGQPFDPKRNGSTDMPFSEGLY